MTTKFVIDNAKRGIAASFCIGFGVLSLLTIGKPLGAFLFAFGLLMVCSLQFNLFTGKCGFIDSFEDVVWDIAIYIWNIVGAHIFGLIINWTYPETSAAALKIVESWSISPQYFVSSIFCGMIMFLAVASFKEGTKLGILFGIPIFILTGCQHCIANALYFTIAGGISPLIEPKILICAIGNWIGAYLGYLSYKSQDNKS